MKPDIKDRALIILSGAFILVVIILIFAGLKIQEQQKESDMQQSTIREKNAVIEYHQNKEGRIVAEKDAAVLRSKDLEEFYPKVVEEIERSFDIKIKNVKAYIENAFVAHGTGTGSIVNNHYYDSGTRTSYDSLRFSTPKDPNLNFKVSFELRYVNNKLTYQQTPYTYTYQDTARTVFSSTKKWWQVWKNEQYKASTMFSNKNSKVVSTTNLLVEDYRDKRFTVSISAGWGIVKTEDEVTTGYFVGPSVSYSLFKF